MQMFAVRCCELEVNSNPIESFFNYECRVPSIGVFFVASFSTDYIAAIVAGLPVLSFLLFFFLYRFIRMSSSDQWWIFYKSFIQSKSWNIESLVQIRYFFDERWCWIFLINTFEKDHYENVNIVTSTNYPPRFIVYKYIVSLRSAVLLIHTFRRNRTIKWNYMLNKCGSFFYNFLWFVIIIEYTTSHEIDRPWMSLVTFRDYCPSTQKIVSQIY